MKTIEDVAQYLTDAGTFYLSTEDGDQPKCRPLGMIHLIDGQIYFGIGDFKDVYRQMSRNPKVEIVACQKGDWLRLYGTAVFEPDYTIANGILEKAPFLRTLYNETNGHKLAIFHLENATAEVRSMMKVEESLRF